MKKSSLKRILKYTGRGALVVLTLLLAVIIALYTVMFILVKGPSETARTLFVRSVMETSAGKFLAYIYLSEEEIAEITSGSGDDDITYDKVDVSLIQIPTSDVTTTDGNSSADDSSSTNGSSSADKSAESDSGGSGDDTGSDTTEDTSGDEESEYPEGIEIIDIVGSTYYGKMIIISDPSRVTVATLDTYGVAYSGKTLSEFVKSYGALGGINAGGFDDPNGSGSGAVPDGIVIKNGEIVWGDTSTYYKCVVGFDSNGILHVGNMTGAEALADGIVNGLSFANGPLLIVNGKAQNTSRSLGGGLNPRTAIGQRSDGAVLMLVINGRQADSLGATYDDLILEMQKYGAVNAANLDGGSSSLMMYDGEYITTSAYLFGERDLPNAFIFY
ncbi:MAG: phosphodiester glycosidase family protein [Clostridiales bacterium]|nr:phosphodiester glycosidase family protein [Clostridiales bacterium]